MGGFLKKKLNHSSVYTAIQHLRVSSLGNYLTRKRLGFSVRKKNIFLPTNKWKSNSALLIFRSILSPKYSIKDAQGNVALTIEGPMCTFSVCGSDVEFQVLSPDGSTEVGKISKQWSGFLREAFTDADVFGINFPIDLDVRMKAVLLGACFLIDFNFFEKTKNDEGDRIGMMD